MLEIDKIVERHLKKGNITKEQIDTAKVKKESSATIGTLKELVSVLKTKGII